MNARTTEIAAEQSYFDAAAKHRARKLDGLAEVAKAAANKGAAGYLHRYAEAAGRAIGGADDAVAFGRIVDGDGERVYLGRHLIRDTDGEILVVNWQTPAAEPYFRASPADPCGLASRRTYTCQGNTIEDFTELVYAEIAAALDDGQRVGSVDPHLLGELARGRTGAMRDIVATIQAAQFDVIRADRDQVLVIEGGPGTGKTAVALHRVSWLLFNHRDLNPADVLVVGPHPTFIRYIGTVLPGLGDGEVELRDIGRLAPDVPRGRSEAPEVSRLKGEARLAGLLARALRARIGAPEPAERLLLAGRFVTLPGAEIAEAIAAADRADLPYAGRRQLFRDRLAQLLTDRGAADPAGRPEVANLVERLWPQQSPAAFLRDLFGSRPRLRAAAGADFTAEEVAWLHRPGADRLSHEVWSDADLPLLDELAHLIDGPGRRYAYLVVDEAQDLSPMQLRSVGRRSATGALTLVGDLAQSTGAWARDSWDEVTAHLPDHHPARVEALRYGYRVPRQAYQLAAQLLPVAAPAVQPPEVVRDGPAEPEVHVVGLTERAGRVVAVATGHAREGRFVGIVCPAGCRREVEAALAANGVEWSSADRGELGGAVNLVSPQEAKGLEFDAVVVVEPEQIVAADPRGHRLLYVALTRTTGHLDVVCVGDPLPLTPITAPDPDDPTDRPFTNRDIHRLAEHLAGQIRAAAPPDRYADIVAETCRHLDDID
ncbi:ATP-binding domain-containing protein [Solwaraspora sp. WMMD1047]|uniref:HelD family protein n=1 Tax=Solwaraspora sp. WMMD1047 TaxID=3016102 RepID=UPI002417BA21|nr:ATP-binding domain-containing protein [Solwaraspora sp. WMMD1047]MDG4832629.1 ATP-binding domain-containing protein [Solwaraspora sp. WMMD1047]